MSNLFLQFKLSSKSRHAEKITEIINRSPLNKNRYKALTAHLSNSSFLSAKLDAKDSKKFENVLQALTVSQDRKHTIKDKNRNVKSKNKDNQVLDIYVNYIKKNERLRTSLSPTRLVKMTRTTEKTPKANGRLKNYSAEKNIRRRSNWINFAYS